MSNSNDSEWWKTLLNGDSPPLSPVGNGAGVTEQCTLPTESDELGNINMVASGSNMQHFQADPTQSFQELEQPSASNQHEGRTKGQKRKQGASEFKSLNVRETIEEIKNQHYNVAYRLTRKLEEIRKSDLLIYNMVIKTGEGTKANKKYDDFPLQWKRHPIVQAVAKIILELKEMRKTCQDMLKKQSSNIVMKLPDVLTRRLGDVKTELKQMVSQLNQEKAEMEKALQLVLSENTDPMTWKRIELKLRELRPWWFPEDQAFPEQDNVEVGDTVDAHMTPLNQTTNEQIGGEQTDDPVWNENIHQLEGIIQCGVSGPIDEVVQEDAALVNSSSFPVANHEDFNNASATIEVHTEHNTSTVNFHGFQILAEHAECLEHIYARGKEFWSTSRFKTTEFNTTALDCLGKALLISQTPWTCLRPEKLDLMLKYLDDALDAGFKLDFLKEGRDRVEIFVNAEVDEPKKKAELAHIDGEIAKLDNRAKDLCKEMEDIASEKGKLEERRTQLNKDLDDIVEIREKNLLPWDALGV